MAGMMASVATRIASWSGGRSGLWHDPGISKDRHRGKGLGFFHMTEAGITGTPVFVAFCRIDKSLSGELILSSP
ncbi:MAG: hypothetical protein K0S58_2947 [Nitrospira sp.]|jgi:hypothetical protein|nr:hypothetical protein [Nitrospira sp.]